MKWTIPIVTLIIFILLAGCTAPTAPMRGIQGVNGTPGSSTIDVNYTFTSAPGTDALVINVGNATDALLDFTIPSGTNGSNLDTSWNLSYYLRDTSRSLTGMNIHRDINNDVLSIVGGTGGLPYGANLQLYGGSNVAQSGGAIFSVGDAAGTGSKVVWSILGTTNTPTLNMNNNNIVSLLDPTNDQDAATKHYVDTTVGAPIVTGALTSTNPVALSAASYVVGNPVGISLRNDQALTINTISTDPALSTSNYSISTSSAVKNYVDVKTTATSFRIGSVTDYTDFSTTGHQTMVGNARPWRDALTDAINIKNTATPGISIDSGEGVVAYTHTAALTDYMYLNIQLNHDRDLSANIYPHIHFFAAEGSTVPNFLVQYRWQTAGGTKVTAWSNHKCNTMVGTAPGAGVINHNIAGNTTGIAVPAGTGLSDIIQFRVIRDHSNGSGVFAGDDPYTGTVNVLAFDVHLIINSLGSNEEYVK
jgi:hypothetical protein